MNPRSVKSLYRPLYSVPIPYLMRHSAGRRRRVPWGLVAFLVGLALSCVWSWWPLMVAP